MKTKDNIISQFKFEFTEFMNSEAMILEYDCLSFGIVEKVLEELGLTWDYKLDTNGWQVDYWAKFKKDDEIFSISGSMYYGNLTIIKGEEE